MKAGRELDALVAEKIFGLHVLDNGEGPFIWENREGRKLPHYSSGIATAWEIVSKLAPLAGDFHEADGFFRLLYADSADHGDAGGDCNPGPIEADADDNDVTKWSAHFHPGWPGEGTEAARLWGGRLQVVLRPRRDRRPRNLSGCPEGRRSRSMKITRTFRDAWITIVAEHANEVVVDFKMYIVVSRNTDGTEPRYELRDSETGADWTSNLDEAAVYCSGHVKWDGCSNLIFDGQNDCMLHFCGNPGRELAARFDALYALAAEMMPGNDEYLLENLGEDEV